MLRESAVQLLFGPAPEADQAALGVTAAKSWEKCVHLAHGWGVLPRLGERISRRGWQPSPEALETTASLILDGYVRSVREAQSGIAVLEQFHTANLPAVAFKGLASMGCLYPDVKTRVILDVDVLIAENDLARAAGVLGQLGFQPEVKSDLNDYARFVRHAPGFGGNEVLSFRNGRGNTIDLHWRLGSGFDTHNVLSQSRQVSLVGKTFPAVCARDGLLLCVHHSLRNHFSPDKIMRDLMDLERWCAVVIDCGELDATLREASNQGLSTPLLAMTKILGDFESNGSSATVAAALQPVVTAPQIRAAEDLRGLFLAQVTEGQIERDLLYLFRPSEMKQILTGLLSGGRRHLEISRSMDAALSGGSVRLSTRLAAVGRALRHVRPGRIRQLRTLARAKDNFGKKR